MCWCFTVNYQFRTRSVLFTEIWPQRQFQFHVTFYCHWCAVSFWTYVLPNWSYSPQLNCLLQRCQYLNLHFQRPKIARYDYLFLILGAIHKRHRNFLAVYLWYPPPPCRNFDPDLPNFFLLISCNIRISEPLPLKYSNVFYGWPPCKAQLRHIKFKPSGQKKYPI